MTYASQIRIEAKELMGFCSRHDMDCDACAVSRNCQGFFDMMEDGVKCGASMAGQWLDLKDRIRQEQRRQIDERQGRAMAVRSRIPYSGYGDGTPLPMETRLRRRGNTMVAGKVW